MGLRREPLMASCHTHGYFCDGAERKCSKSDVMAPAEPFFQICHTAVSCLTPEVSVIGKCGWCLSYWRLLMESF